MSKYLHLLELQQLAHSAKDIATNDIWSQQAATEIHKKADEALGHLDFAQKGMREFDSSKNSSSVAGVTHALGEAARHITDAHHVISANIGEDVPSDVLQVAHLGEAHTLHQNIIDELNEGLRNGS